MIFLWMALVAVLVIGLGAAAWWVRRRESEIGPLEGGEMTDDQRRAAQLGIGLTAGGGSSFGR